MIIFRSGSELVVLISASELKTVAEAVLNVEDTPWIPYLKVLMVVLVEYH